MVWLILSCGWLRPRILSIELWQTRSILVVVCPVTEVEGLGVLGFCDGLSDVRIGEVQDAQCTVLHPRDRFDAVEGHAVRGGESDKATQL